MSSMTYGSNVQDEAVKAVRLLLDATQAGDYGAFVAPGTERFKKGISKAMFRGVSGRLASRLAAGYSVAYLAELKQGDFRTNLWKISFRDGGDEYVMRVAMTSDGKIAGALIN